MTNIESNDPLLEISKQVEKGNVVLFLGAGASHNAGGPTGQKLTEILKNEFNKIDKSKNDFIEVCQDIIDTPPYDRNKLEEFIKNILLSLQPSDSHKIMTKYNWSAIFTTNFDDLVEVAYRTTQPIIRRCVPIYADNIQINPADKQKVYLFKIMGSMDAQTEESGQMVLSRSDYNRSLKRRSKYLDSLYDFVKAGTIVFIGYSFMDRIVLDIMDEVKSMIGDDRMPWSYALFNEIELNEKSNYMFQRRKIRPVQCKFQDFFAYLEKIQISPLHINIIKAESIKILGEELQISKEEIKQNEDYFEILTEEKFNQKTGDKDNFFKGINKSWGCFREGWDFKRSIYHSSIINESDSYNKNITESLKDRIFNEIKIRNPEENKLLLITGMAGVGKSILLRRIAYDIYENGLAPVIFINNSVINFDYKSLASFIENLNRQLDKNISEGEHKSQIKQVIFIDDAASFIKHVNKMKDYLTSRGRSVLIIAAERKSEWEIAIKQFPFRIPIENIYELEEDLNNIEKQMIIEHFYNLGYIKNKGAYWEDIIEKDFENSFFATIYTLVHPSKKPLNEIIQDQYRNLSNHTLEAFRNICCFHQFNLPINLELLVRSLKCRYEDFYTKVIGTEATKIIFEEQDEVGNILFRTHHRIIAKKTIEFFHGDPEIQKGIFIDILKEAVLSNKKEREICEKLLIEHIGPNVRIRTFTYEQQRQIFKIVCEKNPMRSLIHHWGIIETDDGNFSEAERLLKWSLQLPKEDIEAYRGESDQTILTSLGNLYSHMGIDALLKEDKKLAQDYLQKAEKCFQEAKYGEFPNVHAYHAHANMWFQRGNKAVEEIEKFDCYAKSLEILSISKDNINEDELQAIYELETQIWSQIGDEHKIKKYIDAIRLKFGSPRGYFLRTQLLLNKALDKDQKQKETFFNWAYECIEEGLKYFPRDESCLRLKAYIINELKQYDLNDYYNSLENWKSVAGTPNVHLLYELGRVTFILGYYERSRSVFQELETGIGMGHRLRSRTRKLIIDEEDNKKEFEGTIINKASQYEGDIQCKTLRNLQYRIAFRPIACKFTPSRGDNVKFNIGFTFRGPFAVNVNKL